MKLRDILSLSDHGCDTFVGQGPQYPWGGLYGGQIVAQALAAAAETVPEDHQVHSLRAYFIRKGDHHEPVRFEVDRIRNGRSFTTRRVVARQAIGAILNLEASFQGDEGGEDISLVDFPTGMPQPADMKTDPWSPVFDRAFLPDGQALDGSRVGAGRATAWMRINEELDTPLQHACGLAYISDDLPTDAVIRAHPLGQEPPEVRHQVVFPASLDHTIWFHRPIDVTQWHLYDFTCVNFVNGRGLALGYVFSADGTHGATVAQEVLVRDTRKMPK